MAEKKEPYKVLFDYSDVPTLRKFALDNSRIRVVIGPFGSGKTSACIMEILRRAQQQTPSPDGIRRSRWAVVRNCYDDQTEVLTEKRGWQLFKDLLPDDKVASQENEDELVFILPTMHYSAPYSGEMIGYRNRNVDLLVTPDHHLYASMINGRTKEMYGYKFHKAEDIYGMTHYRFKKNIEKYRGGKTEYSERMFEFLGFWFAEGYVSKIPRKDTTGYHWRLVVTQKENEAYVTSLLDDCGFTYGKNKNGVSFNYSIHIANREKELIEKLLSCGKAVNKHVPNWIKGAPRKHLLAFLHGFEEGDGHTRTNKNDSTRLTTASELMANDLQEIIVRSGGSASLNKNYDGEKRGKSFPGQGFRFILTIHQPNQYKPQTQKKSDWYKQQYDGMVYCVEVPSHIIMTRRKGKTLINSQTYNQLKDTTIRSFHDWFPPIIFGEYRVTDHTYILTKFPGVQLEILFRALDRPDQVSNLLSLELTGAYFNEIREIPKAIVDAMDGRIGRYPSRRDAENYWHGMIGDTNAPDEDSWIFKTFEKGKKPDGWKLFKQPSGLSAHAENTSHLPKNYYTSLAKGKDEMYIRIYIHGQYGYLVTGRPVFASFVDNVHVAPNNLELIKGLPLLIGMDFGLTPACTLGQITPFGQLRILDELISDSMGLRQFCENILLPHLRNNYFGYAVMGFGDPSGVNRSQTDESTCYDILHSSEIGLTDIIEAPTNANIPRIGAVEHFLNKMFKGEPGFLLSPKCHYLRKAMNGAYHYEKDPKSTGDEFKPIPVKNFASHISDSLMYLAMYVKEKESNDARNKAFLAQIKKRVHRSGDNLVGY